MDPSSADTAAPDAPVEAPSRVPPAEPTRFERKRELILDAATALINERGVKGMTFVEVASRVSLNTASVTYYFRLKEQLAAAVFEMTLSRLQAVVDEAGQQPDARSRVARFLALYLDLQARIRRGEERPIAVLSDMRALEEKVRGPLTRHYSAIFRSVRDFFGPSHHAAHKALQTARTQALLENVFWLPAWLNRYSVGDYERVRRRLFEVFEHGLARSGAVWDPAPLVVGSGDPALEPGRANFLRAATRLISERGYRGASVERIALELKVTKGSFYHHMDAKDDLVLECFTRSYERVSQAQRAADAAGGGQWRRLSSAVAALLDIQFGDWPLLRTTALQTLPSEVRSEVVERSNRMALRFAGALADGITEGSIRAVDPMIASQAIMATLNAANELHNWASPWPRDQAVALYASTLAYGLFDDRALSDSLPASRSRTAGRPPGPSTDQPAGSP